MHVHGRVPPRFERNWMPRTRGGPSAARAPISGKLPASLIGEGKGAMPRPGIEGIRPARRIAWPTSPPGPQQRRWNARGGVARREGRAWHCPGDEGSVARANKRTFRRRIGATEELAAGQAIASSEATESSRDLPRGRDSVEAWVLSRPRTRGRATGRQAIKVPARKRPRQTSARDRYRERDTGDPRSSWDNHPVKHRKVRIRGQQRSVDSMRGYLLGQSSDCQDRAAGV